MTPTHLTRRAISGRFCRFKKGEPVIAKWTRHGWFLERATWNGQLPLCNQLAGVQNGAVKRIA